MSVKITYIARLNGLSDLLLRCYKDVVSPENRSLEQKSLRIVIGMIAYFLWQVVQREPLSCRSNCRPDEAWETWQVRQLIAAFPAAAGMLTG